jgi:hypothetical protein
MILCFSGDYSHDNSSITARNIIDVIDTVVTMKVSFWVTPTIIIEKFSTAT